MYSENEINRALKKYDETGSITATIVALGYPSRCNLYRWIKNRNLPQKEKLKTRGVNMPEHPRHPPINLKLEILHRCFELGEDVKLVSEEIGYNQASIYAWKRKYIEKRTNSRRFEQYKGNRAVKRANARYADGNQYIKGDH